MMSKLTIKIRREQESRMPQRSVAPLLCTALILLMQQTVLGQITPGGVVQGGGQEVLNPFAVASVTPSSGTGEPLVVIKAKGPGTLAGATAAVFGSTTIPLTASSTLNDGSISVQAPLGSDGSILPVSVVWNGSLLPSTATFTYSIAELEVSGPGYYPNQDIFCNVDKFWTQGGGYLAESNPPANVQVGTLNPIFHVSINFQSIQNPVNDFPPNLNAKPVGNQGQFTAELQMCDIQTPASNSGSSCANWDGNQGSWVTVVEPPKVTLGAGNATTGDIPLPVNGRLTPTNLAGTFRIGYTLAQLDTSTTIAEQCRSVAMTFFQPFNVVVAPAALIQLNTMPYTLLYQPPGDASSVTFETTQSYQTQFSVGTSNEVETLQSSDQSSSAKFSLGLSLEGFGVSVSESDTWDQMVTQTFSSIQGATGGNSSGMSFSLAETLGPTPTLVPGSGETCSPPPPGPINAATPCQPYLQMANAYENEPFWNDTFYLLVHPQFAAWVLGGQRDRYVFYAALPGYVSINISQLEACAYGEYWHGLNPCQLEYSSSGLTVTGNGKQLTNVASAGTVTLSQAEAASYLALDPFYSGSGQAASIPADRAVIVAPSVSYGSTLTQDPTQQSVTMKYTNTQASQSGTNAQTASSLSETTIWGSSTSVGLTMQSSNANEGLTLGSGFKDTNGATWKVTFQNSTAVSTQSVSSISGTLNDTDITNAEIPGASHNPLPFQPSTTILFDKAFGSFMFQDPLAQLRPTATRSGVSACCAGLVIALAAQEARHTHFVDVPSTDPLAGEVGLMASAKILPSLLDGMFHPSDGLTRIQLANALVAALQLPPATGPIPFTDISATDPSAPVVLAVAHKGLMETPKRTFGPDIQVTRQDFAVALARAFALPPAKIPPFPDQSKFADYAGQAVASAVSKGYLSALSDGSFQPTAVITREQAAQAFFLALRDAPLSPAQPPARRKIRAR